MRSFFSPILFASLTLCASAAYGQDTIQLDDERVPECLRANDMQHVVQGRPVPRDPVQVQDENRYLAKLVIVGNGRLVVRNLTLEVTLDDGTIETVHSQRWSNGESVAGGHWLNTDTTWFAQPVAIGHNLDVFEVNDDGDLVIDTNEHPNQVFCIWTTPWPHPAIPENAVEVTVRVNIIAVEGDVLWQYGLDRYQDANTTNPRHGENCWEDVLSPMHGSEHATGNSHTTYPIRRE